MGLHSAGFPLRRQQLPDVLVHLGSRQKGCLGAPMPKQDYIIKLENHNFDFYKYKMPQEDFYAEFGKWYARQHKGKSICLLGIRADESLNRYRAYANYKKTSVGEGKWNTKMGENFYHAYPLYDWTTKDVWVANGKFDFDYNHIYDLFYKAGLSINQMRVASPYHESAKDSLNLYRVLEPDTWIRVVGLGSGGQLRSHLRQHQGIGRPQVHVASGAHLAFLCKVFAGNPAGEHPPELYQ